jgi:hypothetical protein
MAGPSPFLPTGQIGNCFSRLETSGYYWSGARSGFDHVVLFWSKFRPYRRVKRLHVYQTGNRDFDTANIILPMIDLDNLVESQSSAFGGICTVRPLIA